MRQVVFILPLEENLQKRLPPGTYRIHVSGLTEPNDVVSVEARNAANNGWDPAVTINRSEGGRIGVKTVTVNANGLIRASIAGDVQPASCKVIISA